MTNLAHLVEQGLAKRELSRQDLADALQVSPVSVSKWLRRDRPTAIPWRHWPRLCRALHLSMTDWLRVAEREVPHYVLLYNRYMRR